MDESLVICPVSGFYSRSSSQYHEQIISHLRSAYDCDKCVISSSGMAAISATMHGILSQEGFQSPITIVYSGELYCDTPRLFKYLSSLHSNIQLKTVDVRQPSKIVEMFKKELRDRKVILFVESCSNPNGHLFDFSILPKLKASCQSLYTVVDNTWLTEVVMNPFQRSEHVDIVLFSMTKYYGAGVAIGGAIVGSHKVMDQISTWVRFNGQHASPHNCMLIAQNLPSMKDRIVASSALTQRVVAFINESLKDKVPSVSYPLLESHPSHDLAHAYFNKDDQGRTIGPSVFTFKVKASKSQVLKVFKKHAKTIEHKTSFGSELSRTDPWPERDGEYMVCRLAIGYADQFERVSKGIQDIVRAL